MATIAARMTTEERLDRLEKRLDEAFNMIINLLSDNIKAERKAAKLRGIDEATLAQLRARGHDV